MAISQQYALLFARLATDNLVECLPLLTEHHRAELMGRLLESQAPRRSVLAQPGSEEAQQGTLIVDSSLRGGV